MSSPSRGLRGTLLRWGLPRDPDASRHLTGFLVVTVVTVLVTRGALAAAGFPQVGGDGLHVSHVLWGGLLMGLALVLALSFMGPVVRPFVVLLGGVGFGLFVDEVGKFVTEDYDYFYGPTAMLVYASVVALALVGEAVTAGSRPVPAERLAAAVDQAVAGVAGGFSPRVREHAETLLEQSVGTTGHPEAAALVATVRPDHAELPDPIAAVSRAVVATTRRLVRAAWVPWIAVATIVGSAVFAVVRGLTLPDADSSTWVVAMLVAGGAATAVSCAVGLAVRGDRERAFEWFRRGVLASLLVTQVALLRVDEWAGYAMLALDLLLLGLVGAELEVLRARRRDRDVSEAEARVG
ncbi:hypothetical protein [Cellulomonas gilvus]|uniref:Uncharacterized protein n=1 Tax=Cellulomonas gilvus (strain ATCC 13127 / NRRL B-14078) TaxID=593907 RepID=F8A5L8_CELGA|nr:hypothetical protein [Cellulomonas gilvus]AEI12173.1 hypothetical protein Celgi_1662 [Cellulomonas gilvus ATCC 13127]